MKEPKFFHNPRSADEQQPLPMPGSGRLGTGFQWGGMLARAMKMRQSFTDAASKACLIRLQHGHREGPPMPPAFHTGASKSCGSRPGSSRA